MPKVVEPTNKKTLLKNFGDQCQPNVPSSLILNTNKQICWKLNFLLTYLLSSSPSSGSVGINSSVSILFWPPGLGCWTPPPCCPGCSIGCCCGAPPCCCCEAAAAAAAAAATCCGWLDSVSVVSRSVSIDSMPTSSLMMPRLKLLPIPSPLSVDSCLKNN